MEQIGRTKVTFTRRLIGWRSGKREGARGEPARILHCHGELSIKRGKNGGKDPEVNKRLHFLTFLDSSALER